MPDSNRTPAQRDWEQQSMLVDVEGLTLVDPGATVGRNVAKATLDVAAVTGDLEPPLEDIDESIDEKVRCGECSNLLPCAHAADGRTIDY